MAPALLSLDAVTPLAVCVVAFVLGCLAGGLSGVDAEVAARGMVVAGVPLVLGARLAWAGHVPIARGLVVTAAAGLGTALGALAEARAWTPPGVPVATLEQGTAAGEIVQVDGVLRRDASLSPGGGVSLDLVVDRIEWRGVWV